MLIRCYWFLFGLVSIIEATRAVVGSAIGRRCGGVFHSVKSKVQNYLLRVLEVFFYYERRGGAITALRRGCRY